MQTTIAAGRKCLMESGRFNFPPSGGFFGGSAEVGSGALRIRSRSVTTQASGGRREAQGARQLPQCGQRLGGGGCLMTSLRVLALSSNLGVGPQKDSSFLSIPIAATDEISYPQKEGSGVRDARHEAVFLATSGLPGVSLPGRRVVSQSALVPRSRLRGRNASPRSYGRPAVRATGSCPEFGERVDLRRSTSVEERAGVGVGGT
jgi:hypothetical protein